jgi:hypothetical protein
VRRRNRRSAARPVISGYAMLKEGSVALWTVALHLALSTSCRPYALSPLSFPQLKEGGAAVWTVGDSNPQSEPRAAPNYVMLSAVEKLDHTKLEPSSSRYSFALHAPPLHVYSLHPSTLHVVFFPTSSPFAP